MLSARAQAHILPLHQRWLKLLARYEGNSRALPCLVQVASALVLADLERARSAGLPWYLSPRHVAALLGVTSDSLGSPSSPLSVWHRAGGPDWVALERACHQLVSPAHPRRALLAPRATASRIDIWKHLVPAAHAPHRLEEVLERALAGELYVPLQRPPKKERAKAKKKDSKAAPLLGQPEAPLRPQKPQKRAKAKKAASAPLTLPKRFLALDVETTGRGKQDRVWELAVCCFEDGKLVWERVRRFDPERKLEWGAVRITGVKAEDLRGEPPFANFAHKVHALLTGEVVVAHQLHFDRRMLTQEFARVGLEWPKTAAEICTLNLARPVMKKAGKRAGLNVCCEHFGIKLDNHHAAGDDARACGELLVKLMEATKT